MQGLTNKTALITAGASGLGKATCIALLNAGTKVHICDIDPQAIAHMQAEYPQVTASVTDVSDHQAVARMFDDVRTHLGERLDFLVNNAGIAGPAGPLEDLPVDGWQATFDVNVHGAFYVTRLAIPMMTSNGGAIMNLSSTAGLFGYPNRSPYCAAKWAIVGLTKTLAMELGPKQIRVNCICPGAVNGDRMDRVIASIAEATGDSIDKVRRDNVRNTSMTTFVDAEDIANMILFSFSDMGARISGQALTVDGDTHSLAVYDD